MHVTDRQSGEEAEGRGRPPSAGPQPSHSCSPHPHSLLQDHQTPLGQLCCGFLLSFHFFLSLSSPWLALLSLTQAALAPGSFCCSSSSPASSLAAKEAQSTKSGQSPQVTRPSAGVSTVGCGGAGSGTCWAFTGLRFVLPFPMHDGE